MVVRESPDAMAIWRMLTPPASASRTSWSRSAPDSSLRRFQSASRAATSGVTGPSRTWPCRSRRSQPGRDGDLADVDAAGIGFPDELVALGAGFFAAAFPVGEPREES